MDKQQLTKLLQAYEDGTASEKEKMMVQVWLLLTEMESARQADPLTGEDKTAIRQRLWNKLDPQGSAPAQELPTVTGILTDTTTITDTAAAPCLRSLPQRWMRYAAIWALPLLSLISAWLFRHRIADALHPIALQKIQTGPWEIRQLTLPDSSTVVLAANSSIEYPKDFNDRNRSTHIVGKAWFNIAQDPSRPFSVSTQGLLVKVLGTSFEVSDSLQSASVTVHSGKVQVSHDEQSIAILSTHERLLYKKTENTAAIQKQIQLPNSPAWTENRLAFDGTDLNSVFRTVARTYNLTISVKPSTLSPEATFSGHFTQSENWKEVLDIICMSSGLSWSGLPDNSITIHK